MSSGTWVLARALGDHMWLLVGAVGQALWEEWVISCLLFARNLLLPQVGLLNTSQLSSPYWQVLSPTAQGDRVQQQWRSEPENYWHGAQSGSVHWDWQLGKMRQVKERRERGRTERAKEWGKTGRKLHLCWEIVRGKILRTSVPFFLSASLRNSEDKYMLQFHWGLTGIFR